MKIKFRNNPKIWIKYIFSLTIMFALLVGLGVWKSIIPLFVAGSLWFIILLILITSLVSKWFSKKIYTFGSLISRIVSFFLLLTIYIVIVMPTSLLLRTFSNDLLNIKKFPSLNKSYWVRATSRGSLKNMY